MGEKSKKELTKEDLSKVYDGQEFSSLKELFELLGLEHTSGHARTCSRRTVDQYMKLDIKKKNDIKIVAIYDEPLPRDDKRCEKEYGLNDEVENLLYLYFKAFPKSVVTKRKLACNLKCFSEEMYVFLARDDYDLAKEVGIPAYIIHLFKSELDELLRRWMINRLKKFADSGRIKFYEVIMCEKNYYDESTSEYQLYHEKRQETLEKLGFKSMGQVMSSYKNTQTFYSEFNEVLKECNLEGAYIAFRLEGESFTPKKTIDNIKEAETMANQFFAYKLQMRIFSRIEKNTEDFDCEFEKIYEKCDEFMREFVDANVEVFEKSQVIRKFKYPDNVKELINVLLNTLLISDVKLFPEAIREKENFYQPPKNNE